MPKKPKTPQKENINEISQRDGFQTPNYAVDLLVPFIPKGMVRIWECAAGEKKISNRLNHFGFDVISTDLAYGKQYNFLTYEPDFWFDAIITNPPFSIKKKFCVECLRRTYSAVHGESKPFALLIPADYSGWLIEAVDKYGCEKIIPTRRIDYITPDVLKRIQEGEVFARIPLSIIGDLKLEEFKEDDLSTWEHYFKIFSGMFTYKTIYDAPSNLLRKYSSCQFHSMWLTWGFNIGRTETFVELTNEQKNNI